MGFVVTVYRSVEDADGELFAEGFFFTATDDERSPREEELAMTYPWPNSLAVGTVGVVVTFVSATFLFALDFFVGAFVPMASRSCGMSITSFELCTSTPATQFEPKRNKGNVKG